MSVDTAPLAVQILSIYLQHNKVPIAQFDGLLQRTLASFGQSVQPTETKARQVTQTKTSKLHRNMSINESVTGEYIVSFENGKKYRRLNYHLKTLGMTFEQYKKKWRLPADYPSLAPQYVVQQRKNQKKYWDNRRKAAAPQPIPPERSSAVADALAVSVHADPDAAQALPLSPNAAAYVAAPLSSDPSWRTLNKRERKAPRPVVVEVKGKHRVKAHAPLVTGRKTLLNGHAGAVS